MKQGQIYPRCESRPHGAWKYIFATIMLTVTIYLAALSIGLQHDENFPDDFGYELPR